MKKPILLLLSLTTSCMTSVIPPPHPAVVAVRREEEALPRHLRKPALSNPHLWEVLPITSMLHHGEEPVFDREADKVDRSEIYSMLTHAGLVPRTRAIHHDQQKRYHQRHEKNNHQKPPHYYIEQGFFELQNQEPYSHDHLQYL